MLRDTRKLHACLQQFVYNLTYRRKMTQKVICFVPKHSILFSPFSDGCPGAVCFSSSLFLFFHIYLALTDSPVLIQHSTSC
jgi:hypothetical protein